VMGCHDCWHCSLKTMSLPRKLPDLYCPTLLRSLASTSSLSATQCTFCTWRLHNSLSGMKAPDKWTNDLWHCKYWQKNSGYSKKLLNTCVSALQQPSSSPRNTCCTPKIATLASFAALA
jgi:hypothetical protein